MYSGYDGRGLPPNFVAQPLDKLGGGNVCEILLSKENTFYPTAST